MWCFTSRIGTLSIQQLPNARYGLFMDSEFLGSYSSPEMAAEAVYTCSTGHYGWDRSGPILFPGELEDWQYLHDEALSPS